MNTMTMLREEILPGGGHLSFVLKRGQILRMTDIEGGANVSLLMLNPHEKSERLNLPDTLKGQHCRTLLLLRHGTRAGRHHRRYLRLA